MRPALKSGLATILLCSALSACGSNDRDAEPVLRRAWTGTAATPSVAVDESAGVLRSGAIVGRLQPNATGWSLSTRDRNGRERPVFTWLTESTTSYFFAALDDEDGEDPPPYAGQQSWFEGRPGWIAQWTGDGSDCAKRPPGTPETLTVLCVAGPRQKNGMYTTQWLAANPHRPPPRRCTRDPNAKALCERSLQSLREVQ